MNHRRQRLPSANPLVNALMAIVGVLAIIGAIVLGFFTLLVFLGILLILAVVVGIRLWWFGRKLRKAAQAEARAARDVGAIEGEYRVVSANKRGEEAPGRDPRHGQT